MHRILLLGCGKIGGTIARILAGSGDYALTLADRSNTRMKPLESLPNITRCINLDIDDQESLHSAMHGCVAVICALSYSHCLQVAQAAMECKLSYFDLTEDIAVSLKIKQLAESAQHGQAIMPQCGLAPGFTAIIANHLAQQVDRVENINIRVGALPVYPTNSLRYNLTWSTDGLINEYCQPCQILRDAELVEARPLTGLEALSIDGTRYEAFHTSGGIGSLCSSLRGAARNINYKTIRYPGHRDLVSFLLEELQLANRKDLLREILENAIPTTQQDLVLTFCSITGWRSDQFVQISDARKIYHTELDGSAVSAIQLTTAASISAAVDLFFSHKLPSLGFIRQEDIMLDDFLHNRFGCHFALGNTKGTKVTQPTSIIE
ncbi:MAG: saccharopine dehydrogenase-like NADP-dependent oxidoreductase [Crocinitomicaceae bacterium]|jgi:saccharopine dehydrogenase-like NADP-dependent oxidoreductase